MKKVFQTLILVFAVQAAFAQWPCQAYFTYTTDTVNNTVYLYDQSFNMDSSIINVTSWDWTIEYGGASYTYSTQNPSFQIPPAFAGYVGICLTITTPMCSSMWCDTINFGTPPPGSCAADFYYVNNSFLNEYDFYDISVAGNPLATVNSWYWTIRDGLSNLLYTSTQQNINFTFPGNDLYEVCLTIATDSGCSDTWCDYVYINDSTPVNCQLNLNPVITHVSVIGGNDGAIELNVTGGTPPYSYLWNTGAITPDIYFLTSGMYTVNITQADTMCPAYTATFQIMEPYDTIPLDTLYTPAMDSCLGFVPDTFFVTLISVDPSIITVVWTFQGQGMSQNVTVTYAYSNYGNYVIVLSIDCDSLKNLTTYMTYIYVSATFGMEELSPESVKVFPNPVGNSFVVEIPEQTGLIKVFDHLGQEFYSNIVETAGSMRIDASAWPAGIYLLRFTNGQEQVVTKTVIKN
jgi:hypothetical protein